jgi:hypothetical protein
MMAKPKADEKEPAKVGKGQKQCPNCKKVVAARTQKCDCGHEFKAKPKLKTHVSAMSLQDALPEIKKLGGLAKVKTLLKTIDDATTQLDTLKGVVSARALVAEVETLKDILE